jgi:cob(I)alamin adenosyltransferase
MADKGLILIYNGNDKGKTTAALGLALRAAGHGFNITVIQFIKNLEHTGEIKAAKEILADHLEIHPMGTRFTWDAKDMEEVR